MSRGLPNQHATWSTIPNLLEILTYGRLALQAEYVGGVRLVETHPVVDAELGDGGHPAQRAHSLCLIPASTI